MLDIVRKSALILGTPRTKRRWPYIRYGGGILAHTGIYWHIGSRKLRQWSRPCHRIALGSLEHRMRSHSQYRAHILDHLSNL